MSNSDATQIRWHKATASVANGNCVEVADIDDAVLVRDTKNRDGNVLAIKPANWSGFLAGVKAGEFDGR